MERHRLCTEEKRTIHSILDDVEAELFGNHSPYESIQALDDQCSALFPGWVKSRVCQKPLTAPEKCQENEVTQTEVIDLCETEEIPRDESDPSVEAELDALKQDVRDLIKDIGLTVPEKLSADLSSKSSTERLLEQTPSQVFLAQTAQKKPGLTAKIIPTAENIRHLEEELVRLQKEHNALKRQRARIRKELAESQDKIMQHKVRYWRSELIRKKMHRNFGNV